MKLLTRNEFREGVFKRDKYKCVICGVEGKDAHHIIERRLFKEAAAFGGYFLENGATLCEAHHLAAEDTSLSCEVIRNACGISEIILPKHLPPYYIYDKWGNILLENGKKVRGELFYEEPVQKVLRPFLGDFVKYLPFPFLLVEKEVPQIFENEEVVILKVMEGEKVILYDDYMHTQAIDVPLQTAFWQNIKDLLDENLYLCGIDGGDFYLAFVGKDDEYLSWEETKEYAHILNIKPLPVIYEGVFSTQRLEKGLYLMRKTVGFSRYESSKMAVFVEI